MAAKKQINKKDFIDLLAKKVDGVTKKDLERVYDAMQDVIVESVKKDIKVAMIGFGAFKKVERKATIKTNPKTKAKIKVPAKKVMKFKASDSIEIK